MRMCSVISLSFFLSGLSVSTNIISKRDISAGGNSIWFVIVSVSSNLPYFGFAAANIEHLHCSVAVIPAFATDIFCDSIASWSDERSWVVILSSSSIHARPLSARTSAPASSVHRPSPKSSFTAAAVRPAALADFPDAYIPLGARLLMYLSSWDFATPGSPISRTCMSPLIEVPSSMSLWHPPKSCSASASFISSRPYIVGEIEATILWKSSGSSDISMIFFSSASVICISSYSCCSNSIERISM